MFYIYPRKGVKVLEHKHLIIDDDLYFTINAENGKIEYTSKKIIAKGSHNSERITFKLPHYIEGHDMMLCNSVILSYTNIDSTTGESYSGPYEITDMELIDENTIACSWLISDNASKYVGATSFAIDFRCTDEIDYVVYSWPTQRCNGLKIANTINAKETPFERQPDILEQFKSEILQEVSDMDLGSVKTVNNIKPDENGNINIVEPDFYELENKPFECELNLLESIRTINTTNRGVIEASLADSSFICVEINEKKFFDMKVEERIGDSDENLWDNNEGYGFYIVRESHCNAIYIDENRYGNNPSIRLYKQIQKKTLNPQYLPEADLNSYGVVKVVKADEYDDYEQYAPCVTFEGEVHAKTYKAANVFKELSFENLDTLIDYVGNHGLFTESVVEDITNEIELILPVHVWYVGSDYRDYSHKYLFETANGETLLLNIKKSAITKVEGLGSAGSSSGIITLPSEEYPDITPDIFMELPDGLYNLIDSIDVSCIVGFDEEGHPILEGSFITGLFQKTNSDILCYGRGTFFGGLIFDEDNGFVAEYFESLDGAGLLDVGQVFKEFANILGLNEHELSTEDKTIVGAINELNSKISEVNALIDEKLAAIGVAEGGEF